MDDILFGDEPEQTAASRKKKTWKVNGDVDLSASKTTKRTAHDEIPDLFDNDDILDIPEYASTRMTVEDVHDVAKTNGYSSISTFTGCGGSATGFAMAGWNELLAAEFVDEARKTFASNYDSVVIEPVELLAIAKQWFAENNDRAEAAGVKMVVNPEAKVREKTVQASLSWELIQDGLPDTEESRIVFEEMRHWVNDQAFAAHAKDVANGKIVLWGDDIRGLDPHSMMSALGIEPGSLDCFEGSPPCFPAGVEVICKDGVRPIEEVEIGHEVLTKELRWRKVVNTMSRQADTITVNGIQVTPNHPFWVTHPDGSEEWCRADMIEDGDMLTIIADDHLTTSLVPAVMDPDAIERNVTVYDITVDEDHSFIAAGYVVHNCKSFSMAGVREGHWGVVVPYSGERKQKSDDLFFEYMRIVLALRPRSFIAENVAGLAVGGSVDHVLKPFEEEMRRAGYIVDHRLLNAADFGVPQERPRLFIQGIRVGLVDKRGRQVKPSWPSPKDYRYTARQALDGVEFTDEQIVESWIGSKADLLDAHPGISDGLIKKHWKKRADIPEEEARFAVGTAWYNLGYGGTPESTYFQLLRTHPDRPVPTITATSAGNIAAAGITHFDECRKFTIPELRALFTFPTDFIFTGNTEQQGERMGRSVPPYLMRAIATELAATLDKVRGDKEEDQ